MAVVVEPVERELKAPEVKEEPVAKEVTKEVQPEKVEDKPEPVAKTYTQAEVDDIAKKIKDNAKRKRDEARQEAQALRRILLERGYSPARETQEQRPQPAQQNPAPKREEYQDDASYWNAIIDHRADMKARERLEQHTKTQQEQTARAQMETLERTFAANQDRAREKLEDYDEVVGNPALPSLHPVVIQAIKSLENGPDLAYAIASDAQLAMKLSQMSPAFALKELGRIEAKLETPAAPAGTPSVTPIKPASAAPKPIEPVKPSGNAVSADPSDRDSTDVWLAKRNRQLYGSK